MAAFLPLLPKLLSGFAVTLELVGVSGVIALAAGILLAGMRVAPVPVLRAVGTAYVTIFRNTPLVVLFIIFVAGLPFLGLRFSYFWLAVIALSVYTAAFFCEAVRAGINAVESGQAEAARSVGMTFGQNLWTIILPQAVRSVIPPVASILIALAKNTAIAEAFGVIEASGVMVNQVNLHPLALWPLFLGTALGYVIIVLVIAGLSSLAERRLAVSR